MRPLRYSVTIAPIGPPGADTRRCRPRTTDASVVRPAAVEQTASRTTTTAVVADPQPISSFHRRRTTRMLLYSGRDGKHSAHFRAEPSARQANQKASAPSSRPLHYVARGSLVLRLAKQHCFCLGANSLASDGPATLQGGGLYIQAEPLTLTNSVIARNHPDQCDGC